MGCDSSGSSGATGGMARRNGVPVFFRLHLPWICCLLLNAVTADSPDTKLPPLVPVPFQPEPNNSGFITIKTKQGTIRIPKGATALIQLNEGIGGEPDGSGIKVKMLEDKDRNSKNQFVNINGQTVALNDLMAHVDKARQDEKALPEGGVAQTSPQPPTEKVTQTTPKPATIQMRMHPPLPSLGAYEVERWGPSPYADLPIPYPYPNERIKRGKARWEGLTERDFEDHPLDLPLLGFSVPMLEKTRHAMDQPLKSVAGLEMPEEVLFLGEDVFLQPAQLGVSSFTPPENSQPNEKSGGGLFGWLSWLRSEHFLFRCLLSLLHVPNVESAYRIGCWSFFLFFTVSFLLLPAEEDVVDVWSRRLGVPRWLLVCLCCCFRTRKGGTKGKGSGGSSSSSSSASGGKGGGKQNGNANWSSTGKGGKSRRGSNGNRES
uniref:Uncharacterized protein n=1 Tax=Chromera velia CCMP2878 TaxID=1169474 RepID=A0A0G4FHU3_9ALVE|eukprot:Cvel_17086.t1-p1 / transcript=Cvel_17086.t1 / gene=Cvel_17086 / organism=Chromera_velia_CCMP2878 / gene_product=hypothetical protein / transcript_product=hypothetical protein / location=Cvel_scaffold1347:22344-25819(-) / protein_length=431 / sequence_SO=supercontig / SO=protein_coding / is_pseudo=false